ncbi:PQQ-binding-like beta-propeller repeat protein [Streptomyces sp. NPDC087843]|uniref:outer membrane protein assembly factor BamB family protein n=1 Tax=Streptomyces sp. NPDC087843 TaxID=3365804 RepID=UPI003812A643
MSDPTHDACRHAGVGRRGFLGLAGGTLASAGLASLLGAAPASATPVGAHPDAPLRFALVSDTHVNVDSPQSTVWLTQVWASIAARDPDLVLHCGDITDTGRPDEFDRYAEVLPTALHGKMHYSPGNHDVRWDPSAKEEYRTHFGPAPYSFDAGGVHFIGFDPTEVLQEPGHYGPGGLEWLKADLKRLRPLTPTVLFQHFPMGNTFYYVDDQPEVLDVLADHNVRGIFAGHIHKEVVSGFNGLTQIGLNAVRNGALYYWVERIESGVGAPVLRVSRVNIAADGSETEVPVADMPLAGDGQGRPQRPRAVRLGKVDRGQLPVTVRLDKDARATSVAVDLYPQTAFGGAATPVWKSLTASSGQRWTGSVDVSSVVPGTQRLRLQVTGADGSWWEDTARFEVERDADDPRVRWQYQLPGSVQGGIALIGSAAKPVVVAASTTGDVVAIRPGARDTHERLWHAQVGPVYRRPAVDAGARTLFIPSADHRLYALKAADGRQKWRFDAGAPILSAPLVAEVHGRERVFFSAGQNLFALDTASGGELWSVPGRGFSSGRAASDGYRVYTAAGDGYARAHDAVSGEQLWAFAMATGTANHVALYSGWDDVVAVGDGVVVVGSVAGSWGLNATTGALLWTVAGSAMYAPTVVLDDGSALLTTEFGIMSRVDLATGKTRWQTNLAVRVFNAGVVIADGVAWAQSVDGKLLGVKLSDGTPQGRLQHSLAYSFSTPAIAGGTLVVGNQNGVVAGIELP